MKRPTTKQDTRTRDARFRIRLASGEVVTGAVHGSGGKITGTRDAGARLRAAIAAANRGDALEIAEPARGCVRFYPSNTTVSTWLDLRGATLLRTWSVLP